MNRSAAVRLDGREPGETATREYPGDVTERRDPRRMPFGVAAAALLIVSVAWTTAGIASLTLVYGVAAFALTGLRGGFWLFVVVELLQGAWYFRHVCVVGARLVSDGATQP
jgi:fatty acid desaturase